MFCSATEVNRVIIGHFNRFRYLLTYLLTYLPTTVTICTVTIMKVIHYDHTAWMTCLRICGPQRIDYTRSVRTSLVN